jgi:hypothetical protein
MRFPTIVLTVAALVLAAAPSRAFVDQPISGKRIVVRDTPTPKLLMVSNATIQAPTQTGTDDPTFFGATLTVTTQGGESASLDLPGLRLEGQRQRRVPLQEQHRARPASPPSAR